MLKMRVVPQASYFQLSDIRDEGPILGYYAGRAIPAAVIDESGRRYLYAGIAPRRFDGRPDVEALRRGEWLVQPGLVYRRARAGEA